MIKQLIKLADHLDSKGLRKEASLLDNIIIRIADGLSDEERSNAKEKVEEEIARIVASINSNAPRSGGVQDRMYWRARAGKWDKNMLPSLNPLEDYVPVIVIGFSNEFWNTYVPEFEQDMSKETMDKSRMLWARREVERRLSPGFKIDDRFGTSGAAIGAAGSKIIDSKPTELESHKPPDAYDLVAVRVIQDLKGD